MNTKTLTCPVCGSSDTARILYGLVALDDQLSKQLEDKTVVLGGCMVDEDSPTRHCNACEAEF